MTAESLAATWPPPGLADFLPYTPVLRDVDVGNTAPDEISAFADDTWNLYPMALNPAAMRCTLSFASSPPAFKESLKRLVWCLINRRTPVELLQRPTAIRSRLTPSSIVRTYSAGFRPFTRWLEQRGINRLCDADDAALGAYAVHVVSQPASRDTRAIRLWGVTRLWLLAEYLPADYRIGQPPWEPYEIDDLLGPANARLENKTPPIHPQSMSPLLLWALRFANDFSDDIIRASEKHGEMMPSVRRASAKPTGGKARLDAYLNELRQSGQALPVHTNLTGQPQLAKAYLAATLDIPYGCIRDADSSGIPVVAEAPIGTPVHGKVHGEPWTNAIDFYEVNRLVRLLAGACLVVIAYLSGMRPGECRALRRGCCRPADPADSSAAGGFEIFSKTFKGPRGPDGNAIPGGKVRDHPWHVIGPVNTAISVMERIHRNNLLFPYAVFNPAKGTETAVPDRVAARAIDQLIEWCNETAARIGRPDEAIPEDPEGRITMQRFRRTLAWHIYRLPGGRVSLGIQYGHLQRHVTDGYGTRVSAGLRGVFPMEDALARADSLNAAADRLDAGEQVSGPANGRYLAAVAEFDATFRGRVFSPKGYLELLKNRSLKVFDNGAQPVACCYDADKALCHPDRQRSPNMRRSPNLTRCDPRCGNVARTDTHIEEVRVEIGRLDEQRLSPATPEPMRQAHSQRIEMLQEVIVAHEQNRIPARTTDPKEKE